MSEEAIKILKDFLENPDNYFAKKYPHVPLAFYDSVEVAIKAMKKPQLNENQQIVLGQLKINAGSNGSLIKAIHSLFNLLTISSNQLEKDCTEGLLKSKNALARLTRKQAAEVLSAFAQWALEQEE